MKDVRVIEAPYCNYCLKEAFYQVKETSLDEPWINLCGFHYFSTIQDTNYAACRRIIQVNSRGRIVPRLDPDRPI